MKKYLVFGAIILLLTACTGQAGTQQGTAPNVVVYETPNWGCCGDWSEYLEENGFEVEEIITDDLASIKSENKVPPSFQTCHTAIVDGYVIEGHVPATEIFRLLTERPPVVGIAVAGMPLGSPGMDIAGADTEPFEVVTFDQSGFIEPYANYP